MNERTNFGQEEEISRCNFSAQFSHIYWVEGTVPGWHQTCGHSSCLQVALSLGGEKDRLGYVQHSSRNDQQFNRWRKGMWADEENNTMSPVCGVLIRGHVFQ